MPWRCVVTKLLTLGPHLLTKSLREASYLGSITVTNVANKAAYVVPARILVSTGGGAGFKAEQFAATQWLCDFWEESLTFSRHQLLHLFFLFLRLFRESQREWGRGRERERETENPKQVLRAVSTEPSVGLQTTNREIVT